MQNEKYIPTVVFARGCRKHDSQKGEPCYVIPSTMVDTVYFGVCNTRAKSAGMLGKVNPNSMSRTNNGKR